MIDTIIFLSLCFFTLGFLCLIGVISFFLNYYFTLKVYRYYLAYILSTSFFIGTVFVIYGNVISKESGIYGFSLFIYEPLQILIFMLYTYFVYNAMLVEGVKFKKFGKVMNWFGILSVTYIIYSLLFGELSQSGERHNVYLYGIARVMILFVSFSIYFRLIKYLSNKYFRYIFAGCTVLLIFALLALWDSTVNREQSLLKGFQFICIGYVLENLCFSSAFVYRIITVYREKQAAEVNHAKALVTVELESQQQTMKYIGAEIHDNVGQKLTLASIYSNQLAANGNGDPIAEKIQTIGSIINDSLIELRRLSKSLINTNPQDHDLVEMLRKEAFNINATSFCYVSVITNQDEIILMPPEKSNLFRILQEFIQNSMKHSACRKITITLNVENKIVWMTAEDDGKGFDMSLVSNGVGLKNIRTRAEQLCADYQLHSELGTGTKLSLQFSPK